ncbi:MAG: AmmeMemoRadiSam system protein B [Magnetococcales bacterium]|nr:AmmeMemoRadiSam system protein B [Magnetococcales bacterium]
MGSMGMAKVWIAVTVAVVFLRWAGFIPAPVGAGTRAVMGSATGSMSGASAGVPEGATVGASGGAAAPGGDSQGTAVAQGTAAAAPSSPVVDALRQSPVAGSWYPGDPTELQALVDRLLTAADSAPATTSAGVSGVVSGEISGAMTASGSFEVEANAAGSSPAGEVAPGEIRAILVPHAGYQYSGEVAASAVRLLRGRSYRRVVVIGPAHTRPFSGLAVATENRWGTPLGEIPLDREALAALQRDELVQAVPRAFAREHSIDMTLPLLQRALAPGFRLVPVLVGDLDPQGFARAAEVIRPLLDEGTLLVISGDFTHYGPDHGYLPFPPDQGLMARIRELDRGAFEKIRARDPGGLLEYRLRTGITACAFGPAMILTHLLDAESVTTLLRHETSGEFLRVGQNSVSYLAAAFSRPEPFDRVLTPSPVSQADLELLHRMAQHVLRLAVERGPGAVDAEAVARQFSLPERLRRPSGAFVTLERQGRLRGCIGHIEPVEPLFEAVIDNAVSAALEDHRFPPVTAAELPQLEVVVSILSPLAPIATPEAFRVGEEGIVLTRGWKRAVYLPEVAREAGWTREKTLDSLAVKAGLSPGAWRQGSRLEVFTTQVYSAPMREDSSR